MGHLYERFQHVVYDNEADVSQKFVLPLCNEFLGFTDNEILPERLLPTVKIPRNREKELIADDAKIKPDYIIAIDGDLSNIVFALDSKAPNEDLNTHLSQLIAYCISLGTNLIATTNGAEFRVYDAHELVFRATDIAMVDMNFIELRKLLHRDFSHLLVSERIRSLNLHRSLGQSERNLETEKRRRVAVAISDFEVYLNRLLESTALIELPPPIQQAFHLPLQRFPSNELLIFTKMQTGLALRDEKEFQYEDIKREARTNPVLIIGESGIGKTSLLAHMAREQALRCLSYESDVIPVLVQLGKYRSGRDLHGQLIDTLRNAGANITEEELLALLQSRRIFLLLDAFDEVAVSHLSDANRELREIVESFGHPLVVTTRQFRLPQLSPLAKFVIQPLTQRTIQDFSQMYLAPRHVEFLHELSSKGLVHAASNTLLLTLLILLYSDSLELPNSRTAVLRAVVQRLEQWNEARESQFEGPLPWNRRLDILIELAYLSVKEEHGYILDVQSARQVMLDQISRLERQREIRPGFTVDDLLTQLAETGLLQTENGRISLWHRVFQEYLAAIKVAEAIDKGEIKLRDIIKQSAWETVIPLAAAWSSDINVFIHRSLNYNVFAAGRAIIESSLTEGGSYQHTVDCLAQKCASSNRAIRELALNLLQQIQGDYVGIKFHELFESALLQSREFEHIRKVALVELARRQVPGARAIVHSHLNWQSSTRMEWMNYEVHAGASVINALGEFDDEESQQLILDRWGEATDVFSRDSCRYALTKIARSGNLSGNIVRELVHLLLHASEGREARSTQHSSRAFALEVTFGVVDVLIALHSIDVALELVDALANPHRPESSYHHCRRILKSFDEPVVVEEIVRRLEQHKDDPLISERFLDILSECTSDISFDIFHGPALETLPTKLKAYAIRGLGRYQFQQIEHIVLTALQLPSLEELLPLYRVRVISDYVRHREDAEVHQYVATLTQLSGLSDNSRSFLSDVLQDSNSTSALLLQIASGAPDQLWYDIIRHRDEIEPAELAQTLLDIIDPLPYDYLLTRNPLDYASVQEQVFRVLARHGRIRVLLDAEYRPSFLFSNALEVLFETISRDKIYDMEPFLSSYISKRVNRSDIHVKRHVIKAAYLLAELGEVEQAQKTIVSILNEIDLASHGDDWALGDILQGIHLMPVEFALDQIKQVWEVAVSEQDVLLPTNCIEALERIGTSEALDMLAQLAEEAATNDSLLLEPERALRSMQLVSAANREDWLLDYLSKYQDRGVTNRIIDTLAVVGTQKSLPILEKQFHSSQSEKTRFIAFWAIHNIQKSLGRVWYNNEEICKPQALRFRIIPKMTLVLKKLINWVQEFKY